MRVSTLCSSGSSPLARGLHQDRGVVVGVAGIIPARAGFTCGSFEAVRCGGGSSPLARGLLEAEDFAGAHVRIIPARAGFTFRFSAHSRSIGDHPRSRGVYGLDRVGGDYVPGSSPLARGLPSRRRGWRAASRIIPARAGFTYDSGEYVEAREDHPRSRGVYSDVMHQNRPLRTDHPRSRGVYPTKESDGRMFVGSSPLARGLRDRIRLSGRTYGIIPARAGFTKP